ncbi:RDD family protein [uncultured Microbacterium sp.]|uniref:RDD family protein n=1 Tax=uncultured Microbacterium sp. TaxID=191216 RepID=UPI0028D3E6AE|nr:RDD family protein [uncultured Microbacterium sp.]
MTPSAPAQMAPIPRRAIAYLIDAFIATGLAIMLVGGLVVIATFAGSEGMPTTLLIGGPIVVLLLLTWFVVYTLMQAGGGSIGMRAQRLRLITADGGVPIGFARALLRNIVFGLACAIVVGYFTPLFDSSGRFQGWHDRIGGSLMIDARPGASAALSGEGSGEGSTEDSVVSSPDRPRDAARPALTGIPQAAAMPAASGPTASIAPWTVSAPTPPAIQPASSSAGGRAEDGELIAFVPGVSRRAERPAPVERPDAETDLDMTVLGVSAPRPPEDTRISIPGHRLVFTWDDGTRVSVSRRTIFGRNPAAEDGAVVVPVRDETLSLSKTHFEAAAESSGGWVMDRHSTNGMTLVREGRRLACPAGQRVPVRLGDAIEIGDRIVTIGGYA